MMIYSIYLIYEEDLLYKIITNIQIIVVYMFINLKKVEHIIGVFIHLLYLKSSIIKMVAILPYF